MLIDLDTPLRTRPISRPDVFMLNDPAEVAISNFFAARECCGMSEFSWEGIHPVVRPACSLYDVREHIIPPMRAERRKERGKWPMLDFWFGDERLELNWWEDYVWQGLAPWEQRSAPWRPFAGRLDVYTMFPEMVRQVSDEVAGRRLVDVLHCEGAQHFHDWSGLDPYKSWVANDIGFAINRHDNMLVIGRPVATIYAFLGISYQPIRRVDPMDGEYKSHNIYYSALDVSGKWLDRSGMTIHCHAPIARRGDYHYSAEFGRVDYASQHFDADPEAGPAVTFYTTAQEMVAVRDERMKRIGVLNDK